MIYDYYEVRWNAFDYERRTRFWNQPTARGRCGSGRCPEAVIPMSTFWLDVPTEARLICSCTTLKWSTTPSVSVANRIVGVSYVSLQSALVYFGLIPEHVPVTINITRKLAEFYTDWIGKNKLEYNHQGCWPISWDFRRTSIADNGKLHAPVRNRWLMLTQGCGLNCFWRPGHIPNRKSRLSFEIFQTHLIKECWTFVVEKEGTPISWHLKDMKWLG